MSTDTLPDARPAQEPPIALPAPGELRLWPALTILGLYWGATVGLRFLEVPFFFRFLFCMAAPALLLIAFTVWWFRNRTITLGVRLLGYFVMIGTTAGTAPLTHPSVGLWTALMFGLPLVMTVWMLWVVASPRVSVV